MGVVNYFCIEGELISETRNGVESDYIPDTLGNTLKLVNMSGAVTDTFEYWPYGELRSHAGTSVTPLTFGGTLGGYSDQWGGVYFRARELEPVRVSWMSMDPLWPRGFVYAYANSSPTTLNDPIGLSPMSNCIASQMNNLLSPAESCVACAQSVLHFSLSAAQGYCKALPLPAPIGPRRPGPVPKRVPPGWKDPNNFLNTVVTACSYAMPAGTEPLGVVTSVNSFLCVTAQTAINKDIQKYCSDEPDYGKWPNSNQTYWNNYCDYLTDLKARYAALCGSINS
jgi:RHS repeat-associated protein